MYKLRLLSFLFAALFVVTLSSCNKDDDDVEPNRKQLLIAHAWQGDAIYLNGYKVEDNAITLDIKSFRLTFKDDRTFTASYKVSGVPQMEEGLWDLRDNDMKMNYPFLNDPGEYSEVMRLTANNFDVSAVTTFADGTKRAIELRFVPAK